jgi:glycosyltransferase involved in cell wall biosynthesis
MVSSGTVCIIPALNAEGSLLRVLDGVRVALPDATVIGIDDGSMDNTGTLMRRNCERVIRFPANVGKGAALRAGFEAALELGALRVLTIDADGQHDPRFAPALLQALDEADIAVGSRARVGSGMPLHRRVSNALSSAAISAVAGCPLPDTQCGFRAIRAEVLKNVKARGDRYEFETDFIIRAARQGFRIVPVGVPTIYGPSSHFREWGDSLRVVATIWRHRPRARI